MFRLGVVTYLVIVTSVGPALCCCTTARLLASFGPTAYKEGQPRPAPTSCCHHSSPLNHGKVPAEKHSPDCPQCPCNQDCLQPVLSTTELDGLSLLHLRLLPADGVFLPLLSDLQSSLTLSAFRPASGDLWLLPFLSTRDILFHLHMLRC